MNKTDYMKMVKEIQKILESSQAQAPKLEYSPREGFIICTGSIVPGTETAIIKYSD